MKRKICILGSTGSIGKSSLGIIEQFLNKFEIVALSTNKNIKLILKQSKKFNVKNLIIHDLNSYIKIKKKIKRNINIYNSVDSFTKSNNKKLDNVIVGISGLSGLLPTIQIIPFTKNISSANKESIICGWNFIKKQLNKNNTKFIPIDSEHFSIWTILNNIEKKHVSKIYLTASGGPLLNKSKSQIKNININEVIRHPNWSMGKKISIDSATMMNKIFELIEASKIFSININKLDIIIHPKSYVHALVNFKSGYTQLLAHDTKMEIPIFNSIFTRNKIDYPKKNSINFDILSNSKFIKPNFKQFPYLTILKNLKIDDSYFEIILVTINDELVDLYLNKKIKFITMQKTLLKLIKKQSFTKYYKKYPKNISDIFNMVDRVKKYFKENENKIVSHN